jgi:predicted nucleotide-binding protein
MPGRTKKPTILLLDNDPRQLRTWKEVLFNGGYKVLAVGSEDDAKKKLAANQVDLAVIDVRLVDDDNEADESGIEFARTVDQAIPKIILTKHPDLETAVESLKGRDKSVANDYVGKSQGGTKLLQAVRHWLRPKVFLVHGHDGEALLSVKECIKELGLWPVILKDEAAGLVTLLEQFSRYSNVSFAVVIATPDDVGYRDLKPRVRELRPRQNVVFELGFFYAKLPKDRIVLLKKEPGRLRLPSDVDGALWIPLDTHGGWKEKLAQALKKAGFKV